ncbi:MAG: hypothetical protein JO257_24105, partial [Deltaproteobacteria bacterium]|nr:hypothetical protein [Deltaproteobacteria bacterium]
MIDALAPDFIRRIRWTADRIAVEREARLRALVRLAIARSPWHRERLAGVDPDRLTEADLPRLPTMTKRDVMRHFDAITTGLGTRELHTSGSSGERGVFVYSDRGLATWALCFMRFALRDVPVGGLTVTLAASDDNHASSACARLVPGAIVLDMHVPLARTCARLEELQPTTLIGYASLLERLAAVTDLGIAPKCIISTSEPLDLAARRAMEAAWHAEVLDVYATTEGLIAPSCGHGSLHVNDDVCILENVGGKAYLTNLYSDAQPLIRYELGDELAWAADR